MTKLQSAQRAAETPTPLAQSAVAQARATELQTLQRELLELKTAVIDTVVRSPAPVEQSAVATSSSASEPQDAPAFTTKTETQSADASESEASADDCSSEATAVAIMPTRRSADTSRDSSESARLAPPTPASDSGKLAGGSSSSIKLSLTPRADSSSVRTASPKSSDIATADDATPSVAAASVASAAAAFVAS